MNNLDQKTLSDLIGLIYDAALDANLWPVLLDGLSNVLNDKLQEFTDPNALSQNNLPTLDSINDLGTFFATWYETGNSLSKEGSHQWLANDPAMALLSPHLERALKINRDIAEIKQSNETLISLLDQLPIGILILDLNINLLAKNQQADYIFGNQQALATIGRPLQLYSSADAKQLKKLVQELCANTNNNQPQVKAMQLHRPKAGHALSAVVMPLTSKQNGQRTEVKILVMVAAPEAFGELPLEIITDIYGLSAAESKLVQSLVKGMSTQEISDSFGISKNTVSSQLKAAFSKTGTKGQTDLVRHVLTHTSPMVLTARTEITEAPGVYRIRRLALGKNDESMKLPDGRTLSYSDSGDPNGIPVILLHAIGGSRLQRHPDDTILTSLGIRLILPDRPGMGRSDAKSNRTLLEYADDIVCLANHLSLDRFHLIGYSVGGTFALATAHQIPDRIIRLGLIASMTPFETMGDLEGMIPLNHMVLSLGRHAPSILMPFMHFMVKGVQRNPAQYFTRILDQIPDEDQKSMKNPVIRASYIESFLEGFRQGAGGLVLEQLLISRHWGFSLSDVRVPTLHWHGEQDRHVTLKMAQLLADQLPSVVTTYVPGAGHFLFYEHWREILGALVSPINRVLNPITPLPRETVAARNKMR